MGLPDHDWRAEAEQAAEDDIAQREQALRGLYLSRTQDGVEALDAWLGDWLCEHDSIRDGLTLAIAEVIAGRGRVIDVGAKWIEAARVAFDEEMRRLAVREHREAGRVPSADQDEESWSDEWEAIERIRGAGGHL